MPTGPVTRQQGLDRDDPPLPGDDVGVLILVLARGQLGARARRLAAVAAGGPRRRWSGCCVQGAVRRAHRHAEAVSGHRHAASAGRPGAAGAAGARSTQPLRGRGRWRWRRPAAVRCWRVLALLVLQIALGGWVSTNYAVLACSGFPQCNGAAGGRPWTSRRASRCWRELGRAGDGELPAFRGADGHPLWCTACLPCVVLAALVALAHGAVARRGARRRRRWLCWRWLLRAGGQRPVATWCSAGRCWRRCCTPAARPRWWPC